MNERDLQQFIGKEIRVYFKTSENSLYGNLTKLTPTSITVSGTVISLDAISHIIPKGYYR